MSPESRAGRRVRAYLLIRAAVDLLGDDAPFSLRALRGDMRLALDVGGLPHEAPAEWAGMYGREAVPSVSDQIRAALDRAGVCACGMGEHGRCRLCHPEAAE